MRLIDADALIKCIEDLPNCYNGFSDTYDKACIIGVIDEQPTAQSEIIRCKDCKHNPKESWLGCPMSHLSEEQRPETAWCWKGERKDDE